MTLVRLLPVLLLLAALTASTGCFDRGDDDGDKPPATSMPVASTPDSTPAPKPPTTSSPASPPPPEPRQPQVVYNGSHDFAGPPPLPNAPPKTENFTVDAGYATLQVRIAWTSASSGPAGDVTLSAQATVRLVDPSGTAVVECAGKDDPDCSKDLPAPAAGAWKVEYSGSATTRATVTVVESP